MKDKLYRNVFLFTLSFVVGILTILIVNSTRDLLGEETATYKKIELLEKEISEANGETQNLISQLNELSEELQATTEQLELREEVVSDLNTQLENYQILSGEYDVTGPGIIIDIKEPEIEGPFSVSIVNQYYYLLGILSNLNSAGAEAISINEQRYSSYTEIIPVSDFLNINGKFVTPPIQILAIGDSRTLSSSVNFLGGVLEQMRAEGFIVEVTESDSLIINGLDKVKEFEYAQPYTVENVE